MKNKFKYLIILFIASGHIFGCDCEPEKTVKDELKKSDIVIHGKIIKAILDTTLDKTADPIDREHINEYTVLVLKKYKGKISTDTITIRTAAYEESCGIILNVGLSMIFYAKSIAKTSNARGQKQKSIYRTSDCTRTRLFNQTEEGEIEKEIGSR